MPLGDTIAALATAPGRSTRAILRLSGPGVTAALRDILTIPSSPAADPPANTSAPPRPAAFTARFALTDTLSLPVLAMRSVAPRSYTAEDTLEIIFPGNPYLAERMLARVLQIDGIRLASPGEFTARAYLNDKLTLDQAEGVAAAIAAESNDQLAAARDLLEGNTGAIYREWLDRLATLLALVEAGIDFTDQEDVVPIPPRDLHAQLTALHSALAAHLGAAAGTEATTSLPRIVIAGRPNAGKSTLYNALLGRQRAVVSDVAGTTRDVLEEPLDLSRDIPGGCTVLLIDLAGLDESLAAQGSIDAQAQQRAADALRTADVIIHCDPTVRFDLPLPTDASPPTTIRLRTKADLPISLSPRDSGEALSHSPIDICALDGWNLPLLRRAIADAATGAGHPRAAGIAALLPRHRREMVQARAAITEALGAIDPTARSLPEPEVIAGSLRAALDSLGELAGHVSPDDVIGRIFATFCIGK